MEKHPDVFYKYNPIFYLTNTSKSLLKAIEDLDDDVIWMNGDVVFQGETLNAMLDPKYQSINLIAVNNQKCGEEEVKYRKNQTGEIIEISKTVNNPEGESVGINIIRRDDLRIFYKNLGYCNCNDYFEKGIEKCIDDGMNFYPVDISQTQCIEVDFKEDWDLVISNFKF
jgi:choline kinase